MIVLTWLAWLIVYCLLVFLGAMGGYRVGSKRARLEEREKCLEMVKALRLLKG